jgi:hypothetical protein
MQTFRDIADSTERLRRESSSMGASLGQKRTTNSWARTSFCVSTNTFGVTGVEIDGVSALQ